MTGGHYRVMDDQLTDLVVGATALGERLRFFAAEVVHELRARRTIDLTAEEREAIKWLADEIRRRWPNTVDVRRVAPAVAVIDKILGGRP